MRFHRVARFGEGLLQNTAWKAGGLLLRSSFNQLWATLEYSGSLLWPAVIMGHVGVVNLADGTWVSLEEHVYMLCHVGLRVLAVGWEGVKRSP